MGGLARKMNRALGRQHRKAFAPELDFMIVDALHHCTTEEMRTHRTSMLEVAKKHGVTVVEKFSPEWERLVELGLATAS